MHHLLTSHHPRRHIKSFKYAFEGLLHTLLHEPNFRIQLLITFLCVFLGFTFKITETHWGLLTISLGLLLSAEMINTVVENVIDVLIKEEHSGAKIIKDVSSGFVLMTALTTLIIMFLVFYKPITELFV